MGRLPRDSQNRAAVHRGSHARVASSPQHSASHAQKRKGSGPWTVVLVVALLVLLVSAGCLAYLGLSYWQGQRVYDRLEDAVEVSESTQLADFKVDWSALAEINPDVVGWIYVPGTIINYPIVHRAGDDSYYLTHNFNGETVGDFGAEYGAIMLSGANSGDFSDEANFIYGHHMSNGMMFACLQDFAEADEFNAHREAYVLTPEGNYLLSSFAIIRAAGNEAELVSPNFASAGEMEEYVQGKMDHSLVTPDPASSSAQEIDKVFALITCDSSNNTYRYIPFFEVVDYYSFADGSYLTGKSLVDHGDLVEIGDAVADRVS
ncbi:MAG: class B sortase [Eggerthellaceae bacterium]|nr:class B sortase [Eggerthellaceae bacterium]